MEDLTGQQPANLVPSSQSEGGECHDNGLAMTAPGSQPISVPSPDDPGQPHEKLPMAVDDTAQSDYRRKVSGPPPPGGIWLYCKRPPGGGWN
jgi:hypothetical protein